MQNVNQGKTIAAADARQNTSGQTMRCAAESEALLHIFDAALPLAESSEALIAKFGSEVQPDSLDAREGLRLRLALANLLGPLNDLECCSEHTPFQREAATLLGFYLHMISRSFEVRFSRIVGTDFRIVTDAPRSSERYERLQDLRKHLRTSLSVLSPVATEDRTYASDQSGGVNYRMAANRKTLGLLIVIGILFSVGSVAAAIWAQAAAGQISTVCTDNICHTTHPLLYTVTAAVELSAPALLGAGVIVILGSLIVSRLLVGTSLRRMPSRGGILLAPRARALTKWLVWVPACVLIAASAASILYLSNPASAPHLVCSSDARCAPSDNYAFFENLHLLAPAILLAGLTCVFAAVLLRSIPQVDPDVFETAEGSQHNRHPSDPSAFMRPA
ncbi:MAG: hypothetical protein JWQ64_695 [Subtercola sp.]|nr:hypothetical protein [Subtercola sp.]